MKTHTHTHTPGPFHITKNTTTEQFVTETKIRDEHQSVIAVLHVNSEGNGPLFAAAPDLLEALRYLDDAINEPSLKIDLVAASNRARAVIAKAEGVA